MLVLADCAVGFRVLEGIFLRPDAVLPEHCQTFTVQVEIDQREVGAQAMMVFGDTTIPHLIEAEDALQNAKRVFDLGPDTRLTPILLLL